MAPRAGVKPLCAAALRSGPITSLSPQGALSVERATLAGSSHPGVLLQLRALCDDTKSEQGIASGVSRMEAQPTLARRASKDA